MDYPGLPQDEVQRIEQSLTSIRPVVERVSRFPPDWLASAFPYESTLPHAWAAVGKVNLVLSCARYHLLLAHLDRAYYGREPIAGRIRHADVLPAFLFNSYALHALAAENHLAYAVARLCSLPVARRQRPNFTVKNVRRLLSDRSEPVLRQILSPLLGNADWHWVRLYRHRWTHLDPVRVEELGIQFEATYGKEFWWRTETEKGVQHELKVGGGAPAEAGVEDLMAHGRKSLTCFAAVYECFVDHLVQRTKSAWQKGAPFADAFKVKFPED